MDELSSIDLNWLRALSYLLETGSVSQAARRAGIGQPAMSRTLAHLRRVLGDALLVPDGRGSRLTEHAESLRPRVEEALSAVHAAFKAPAKFDPARERFELRVAANDYMHTALLTPWFRVVRELAPQVQLHMEPVSEHSISLLASGDLDFVLGPAVKKPGLALERFVARPLWSDHYVCAMSKHHPYAKGRLDLKRLASAAHIRVSCGNLSAACDGAVAQHLPGLRPSVQVQSFLQAVQLARESQLVAIVPSRLLSAHGDLCGRPLPFEVAELRIYLAFHPRFTSNARHKWLRNSLLQHAQSLAPLRTTAKARSQAHPRAMVRA